MPIASAIDLAPAKLEHVIAAVRDCYLRSAPTFDAIPPCPREVHQYVFDVTLRLLGQIAGKVATIYDNEQRLEEGRAFARSLSVEHDDG